MKKNGILNGPLSKVVAALGHTDKLVICDSGLSIPRNAEVIDLALTKNIPRFIETLKIILEELEVEKAIIAAEIVKKNESVLKEIQSLMNGIKLQKVSHEMFKEITRQNGRTVFVRTGEATPYANIILIAGVTFN
ncbi:MAG: D-ribose pyranase [Ignavibacteria bacterium]|nr:D-ribose pyranase [Ignavibacteria bacterium]